MEKNKDTDPALRPDVDSQSHSWKENDTEASSSEEDLDGGQIHCDCHYPEDFDDDESLSSLEEHSDHSGSLVRSDSAEPIEQVEYPDDFEDVEVEEECEDEAPRRPHEDVQEEEFQLRDAGGLTITLKALKEKG